MAKKRRKNKIDTSAKPGATGFGSLASALAGAGLKQASPKTTAAQQDTPPKTKPASTTPALKGKVVLRTTRKGRGGKTVTLVEQLALGPGELSALAKTMKRRLGCGVSTDGKTLVIQGDQSTRLRQILSDMGASKVVGP